STIALGSGSPRLPSEIAVLEGAAARAVGGGGVAGAAQEPAGGGEAGDADGAAGGGLVGADADLGAEARAGTRGEAGGGSVEEGGVGGGGGGGVVTGHDGLGVARAVGGDVRQRLVEVAHPLDGHDERPELDAEVGVAGGGQPGVAAAGLGAGAQLDARLAQGL